MKFHRRVPSFSFTSFSFNNNNNNHHEPSADNHQQQTSGVDQSHSQPSSPSRSHFDIHPIDRPPLSAAVLPSHPNASFAHQQQQQQNNHPSHQTSHPTSQPHSRNGSITLSLSRDDPLQFVITQKSSSSSPSSSSHPIRQRSGSLIEQSIRLISDPLPSPSLSVSSSRRRSSFAESLNHSLSSLTLPDRGRLSAPLRSSTPNGSHQNPSTYTNQSVNSNSNSTGSGGGGGGTSQLTRHRKKLSNLFSPLAYYTSSYSRSPSPANRNGSRSRLSSSTGEHTESDRESTLDSSNFINPQIDLQPSSESDNDDSDSNHSDRSTDCDADPDFSDSQEEQTILANTNANASSITPIDFLQKSNQPIPFIDQAPNLTSPPPLPISFAPTDPHRLVTSSITTTSSSRKPSTSSRSSLRRRTSSIGALKNLQLSVSRPVYQKNRCTITIEHGDWAAAAKKAERTRFYLVACDLSDESKYAIEWTIGTVLRQGDECLIIMIIETDSKFDPEDGAGSAADRTAKIRNQKDRQEKATLLVREATALLERTGLNTKVTCQAIHGKNPKRMLIDCIDYLEPNLVIVGRRGMTSSKSSLMGSVSHYLLQKSSVPVMVARRRLRTLPKVYKKKAGLTPTPQVKLQEASIEKLAPEKFEINENKRLSVVSEEIDVQNQFSRSLKEEPDQEQDIPNVGQQSDQETIKVDEELFSGDLEVEKAKEELESLALDQGMRHDQQVS